MRLKNNMDDMPARCLGKCLAFAFIVIGVAWLLLIIALVKHTANNPALIVLKVVCGIWVSTVYCWPSTTVVLPDNSKRELKQQRRRRQRERLV